jgi:hypothetical protein
MLLRVMANTEAALALAAKILRMQTELDAAKREFEALLGGAGDKHAGRKAKHLMGKQPDPNSVNQRVLVAITKAPEPQSIDVLSKALSLTAKQVRQAIAYHHKRKRLVNVGPNTYTLKESSVNGSGLGA